MLFGRKIGLLDVANNRICFGGDDFYTLRFWIHITYTHISRAGEIKVSLSPSLSLSLCFLFLFFFSLSLSLAARGFRALYFRITLVYILESLHGVRLERKAELVLFLFREVRDYFPGDTG